MTWVIAPVFPAPERPHPLLDHHPAAHRPLRSRTVTTSSNLPTQLGHQPQEQKSASKNILRRSNVLFAPRSSHVLTTFVPICALIQTSDHSYARSVEKPSLGNTIVRGMRACTAERRNLFAVVSLARAAAGGAVEDLLVRTHSAGTSEAKLAESASSHC